MPIPKMKEHKARLCMALKPVSTRDCGKGLEIMDEETPHLHIDFVPFVSESKRGLDTRVSMKQALASMGFKGGTKQETEWSQWIASEKQELAKAMERHGVIWKQKGTHRKHLSVLDFEKQEREKEVQILTSQKEEINRNIQEIQKTVSSETKDLKRLQGKKQEIQQEIIKLSSDKKTTEKNIPSFVKIRRGSYRNRRH